MAQLEECLPREPEALDSPPVLYKLDMMMHVYDLKHWRQEDWKIQASLSYMRSCVKHPD